MTSISSCVMTCGCMLLNSGLHKMAAHARAAIRHLAQEAERPAAERFFVGESLAEFKQVSLDAETPSPAMFCHARAVMKWTAMKLLL